LSFTCGTNNYFLGFFPYFLSFSWEWDSDILFINIFYPFLPKGECLIKSCGKNLICFNFHIINCTSQTHGNFELDLENPNNGEVSLVLLYCVDLASLIWCCLGLEINLSSCARGHQWCGIFHCHWWTPTIKLRLLFFPNPQLPIGLYGSYAFWGLLFFLRIFGTTFCVSVQIRKGPQKGLTSRTVLLNWRKLVQKPCTLKSGHIWY